MRRNVRLDIAAVGVAIAAFGLASCSSGSSDELDTAVQFDARLTAFTEDEYRALAGPVEFTYNNGDTIPHSLVIEGVDDFRMLVSGLDDTATETLDLEAGTYVVFCDIVGHREQGMETVLTLE